VIRLEEVKSSSSRSVVKVVLLLGLAQLLAAASFQMAQRTRMLDAVARSEARLVDMVESVSEAMLVVDTGGALRIFNRAAERVFARSRKDVLGLPLIEALPELSLGPLPGAIADAMKSGEGVSLAELRIGEAADARTFGGRVFPFERGATVFLQDVTEKRRAEEAVRKSEALLKLVLDTLPVGVWVADREGRILLGNPAGERIWNVAKGVPLEENAQIHGLDADTGRPLAPREWALARALAGSVSLGQTVEVSDHAGGRRVLLHSAVPAKNADGEIVGAVAVNEDVTSRRELQEELRQAQKMEAVGRLAGGIAHDFNNLLTTMLGYASLLQSELPAGGPEHESVLEIRAAAERAARLTQQLLAFSRKQVLSPHVLSLNGLIDGAASMLRHLIGENVDLVTRLDPELPTVRADRGQLEQVIVNLAINARDAMPDGGTLTIETRAARPEDAVGGRWVGLTVSDTGTGIEPDVQARMFDPFFTTKAKGKGTGLGLSTVYGIVKQSGGTITVSSERGAGASFRILLPAVDESAEESKRSLTIPAVAGLETILLAEDEEKVRELVRGVLASSGYTVLVAKSGTEALELSSGHSGPIHLLLTDVVMPGLNGPQLVQRLLPYRPETKVLYMSGYTDDAIGPLGVLDGGAPFLQKPFTPDRLSKMVREVLGVVPAPQSA
jgi:PAS domain S-box-containing protein